MNISETAAVLAKIRLIDNREINELVIREWHDSLSELSYGDAVAAVREHRKRTTDYLQPAHLVALAEELRPKQLSKPISDVSYYCTSHWWPKAECPRCEEDAA